MNRREEYTHHGPIVTFHSACLGGCGRDISKVEYRQPDHGGWQRRDLGDYRIAFVCPDCQAAGRPRPAGEWQ